MKNLCFAIFSLLFFIPSIRSQNAISAAVLLTPRHYEFNYDYPNPSTALPNSVKTGSISLTQFPLHEISFQHFSKKGNFSQYSLYGWRYINDTDINLIIQESSGLIAPTNGSRLSQFSIGLRFRQGFKIAVAGNDLPIYISGTFGSFYQNIQNKPNSSQDVPIVVNNISIEMGTGVYMLKYLGQHAYLSFGIPIPVYQMDIEILDVQHPALSFEQQRRTRLVHNFDFWKRMGVEAGAGIFFQQKKR